MRRQLSFPLLGIILIVGSGCGSDSSGGGNNPVLAVAKTSTSSGDAQTGAAGAALPNPLRVIVTEDGVAKPGVAVTWSAVSGGSMAPASGTTDASGIAASVWTLGPGGGAQTARATVAGATGSPITFSATATTGPVISLTKTPAASGDGQYQTVGLALPQPLRVVATSDGAPLTTAQVAWSGPGTFTPATSTADANGILTTSWTLPATTGSKNATATLTNAGVSVAPVVFTATGIAVNTILVVNNSFHPGSLTLPAGGATVTWLWDATAVGHNVKPSNTNVSATPNSGGAIDQIHSAPFSFTAALNASGTYRFYCSVHGILNADGTVSAMSGQVIVP